MKQQKGPLVSVECLTARKRGDLLCYSLHCGDFDSIELAAYVNLFSVDTISKGDIVTFLSGWGD